MSKVTNINEVKCSICSGYIEPLKDKDGIVVWEHGNNAQPINDGRCCDKCNWEVVIPARIVQSSQL